MKVAYNRLIFNKTTTNLSYYIWLMWIPKEPRESKIEKELCLNLQTLLILPEIFPDSQIIRKTTDSPMADYLSFWNYICWLNHVQCLQCTAQICLFLQESSVYINELVKPVLANFQDQDSRVRYYSCEALYNIVKVARGSVLPYFNDIFDGLSKVMLSNTCKKFMLNNGFLNHIADF